MKTVLVTGCSSGIGHDCAHGLAAAGWRVFAAARRPDDVARLRDEGLEAVLIDYEDAQTILTGLADVLEATEGRLDGLVNNGAYAIPAPVEDLPTDALRAIFEANLFGWHELTVRAIPAMRARGQGRIVNVSSVLGLVAAPWRGAYNATKFALEGLTRTLRMEMKGTGIEVVAIEPGPIATDFRRNAVRQFERWIDWERSARVEQYRESLLKTLYEGSGNSRFQLPPSAVTKKIRHALETPRPRARYLVTTPTYMAEGARRLLPDRALDWFATRG